MTDLTTGSAGIWQVIPDFDHLTAYGKAVCSICGSTSKPGDPVFRPPVPDDVDGYHDICADCIRQAAHFLGFADPAAFDNLENAFNATREAYALQTEELASSREALATVVRDNVRLQDVIDDLNSPVFETIDDVLADEDAD